MTKYSGSITYNEYNVPILISTITDAFHKRERYTLFAFGLGLLVASIRMGVNTVNGAIFLLLAVIVVPSLILKERLKINEQVKAIKGKPVSIKYRFNDDALYCYEKGNGKSFHYNKMVRLVDHKSYLFICPEKDQAFMVDKKTLSPHNEASFKAFMSEKTGLSWK